MNSFSIFGEQEHALKEALGSRVRTAEWQASHALTEQQALRNRAAKAEQAALAAQAQIASLQARKNTYKARVLELESSGPAAKRGRNE